MKKWIALLLAMVLCLSLAACGSKNDTNNANNTTDDQNTPAAGRDDQVDEETKRRRADIVMQTQSHIMAAKQAAKVGQVLTVLSDGLDEESGLYLCRTAADAPEIDGCVCVQSDTPLYPGEFYQVKIEDSDDYDLFGVLA